MEKLQQRFTVEDERNTLPEPFYWGLLPFLWKRLRGWRDQYGRKARFIGFNS